MKWRISLIVVLVSCVSLYTSAESSQCPDGKASCPVASTCCHTGNSTIGCCAIQNAVCCEDSKHCCPHGYSCDVSKGVCKMDGESVPLPKKIPATPTTNEIASEDVVVCPGGEGQCPADHSCCPIPGSNQLHCCPLGYSCDKGICQQTQMEFPAAMLTTSTDKVVKCNQETACPDRYTCCKTSDSYQCCPWPEAMCCSDNIHCCPRGFKCSADGKSCSSGSHRIAALSTATPKTVTKSLKRLLQLVLKTVSKEWLLRTATEQGEQSVAMTDKLLKDVRCPGGKSYCPSGQTCCKLSSSQWGCCPLLKAVCCSDGIHCCPHDYTCNVAIGTCERKSKIIPILQKTAAKTRSNRIVCPDGVSECPDKNTCCQLSSGGWACCPLPNAVCCTDEERCCPEGYTCDSSGGTCSKGSMSAPSSLKMPAFKRNLKVRNVVCPDEESECPDDNTCCKLSSGDYGCCPLPNAVCCSDGEHCCPEGYTCDVEAGTCNNGLQTIALLQKMAAVTKVLKSNVVCPGGSTQCPDDNTCCKLASGGYGCCPLPNAVCCSDGEHCCPEGYTCNTAAGTCQRGMKTVPLVVKSPALKTTAKDDVICPDGHRCLSGSTCCELSSGGYGCCPLPDAVCCSDGVHCCPEGYTCDTSAGTCQRGMKTVPLVVKLQALKKTRKDVICPDGHQCPSGSTCCELSSGGYGCCPLPDAVCCSDGVHCCPEGYTCDTSAGTCLRGLKTVPMVVKTLALKKTAKVEMAQTNERRVQSVIGSVKFSDKADTNSSGSVICPDKVYQCPKGNTCCKLHSGSYGCCPIEKAVCCNDDKHCCPQGYTCDIKRGKCNKQGDVSMVDNIPAADAFLSYVECPDGSECLDYETCCEMSGGGYGCCPMPHAVCCEDKQHCCPCGYRCDLASETCTAGGEHFPMLKKTKSARRRKTQMETADEKLHFIPGRPKDGNPVHNGDLL